MAAIVLIVLLVMPVSYYLGRVLLRPLVEKDGPPRFQFLITDIYALIAQFMLAGTILTGDSTGSERNDRIAMMIGVWVVLAWWWWLGVRRLSRAGVFHAWRRVVFLIVAVPFAFGNFFFLLLPVALNPRGENTNMLFLITLMLVFFMVFSGCRKLALWAMANSQ